MAFFQIKLDVANRKLDWPIEHLLTPSPPRESIIPRGGLAALANRRIQRQYQRDVERRDRMIATDEARRSVGIQSIRILQKPPLTDLRTTPILSTDRNPPENPPPVIPIANTSTSDFLGPAQEIRNRQLPPTKATHHVPIHVENTFALDMKDNLKKIEQELARSLLARANKPLLRPYLRARCRETSCRSTASYTIDLVLISGDTFMFNLRRLDTELYIVSLYKINRILESHNKPEPPTKEVTAKVPTA